MEDNPDTVLPVYHTPAPSDELAERSAAAWVRFGRDVIAAHQPDGDSCLGCGRIWDCCPVVVSARQNRLGDYLRMAAPDA